jgi:hypothetical protein
LNWAFYPGREAFYLSLGTNGNFSSRKSSHSTMCQP